MRHWILFSLTVLLFSSSSFVVDAQKRKGERVQPAGQDMVLIWKVGSPYDGDTPENIIPFDLQLLARKTGHKLRMETFPAKGFAQKFFDAVLENKEPDILAFDNYGIMDGASTRLGSVTGIATSAAIRQTLVQVKGSFASLESGRGGWEYLLTTSRNHAKAKALALQGVECDGDYMGNLKELPSQLADEIKKFAQVIARAFYDGDRTALDAFANGRYPGESLPLRSRKPKINSSEVCGIWGNERLAFVNYRVSYEAEKSLGQENLLFVLKKDSGWNLLLISDSARAMKVLSSQMPQLSGPVPGAVLRAPSIIAPPDGTRFKQGAAEIQWAGSGEGVVAYLMEFQFGQQGGIDWSGSGFRIILPNRDGKEFNRTGAPRIGAQPHRFRIWAVATNGDIRISEWRAIDFTY